MGDGTILEVAMLDVRPDQEEVFETTFSQAQTLIASIPGYQSHEFQRCLENHHAISYWCTGMTWKATPSVSANPPNTSSGRRSCTISTIPSRLWSTTPKLCQFVLFKENSDKTPVCVKRETPQ